MIGLGAVGRRFSNCGDPGLRDIGRKPRVQVHIVPTVNVQGLLALGAFVEIAAIMRNFARCRIIYGVRQFEAMKSCGGKGPRGKGPQRPRGEAMPSCARQSPIGNFARTRRQVYTAKANLPYNFAAMGDRPTGAGLIFPTIFPMQYPCAGFYCIHGPPVPLDDGGILEGFLYEWCIGGRPRTQLQIFIGDNRLSLARKFFV